MVLLSRTSEVITIISALAGLIPSDANRGSLTFRVWVGKDGAGGSDEHKLNSAGGHIPEIQVWDTANKLNGKYHGNRIRAKGNFGKYFRDRVSVRNNEQFTAALPLSRTSQIANIWLLMRSNYGYRTDGICMTTFSWQASDNIPPSASANSGVLPGDLLYFCGYPWYYSGNGLNGRDFRCAWLDADNSIPRTPYFVNINVGVMGKDSVKNFEDKDLCGLGVGVAVDGRIRKRAIEGDIAAHRKAFGNRANVHQSLSAIALCDSPTSWGSSFYCIDEGVFCDMSTKTKYKICDANSTEPCASYEQTLKRDGSSKIVIENPGARPSTKPIEFVAEYFTITDFNGTVIDDGMGL
ncbi:hypothetical protein DFQ27_007346 [Actinomortierella ambigua]|uniref:Uncharacterized protein n=1 Tax=Actinomortierella ambigua TaxID=1343610 RepID=A0A9P6PV71_9FUNG|nr:hypothetical protein DFQ27_007346 [Actinomortierella ambigua]